MRAPHVPHLVSLVPHAAADNIRAFTQQTRSTVLPDECIAAPEALPDPGRGNRTGTTALRIAPLPELAVVFTRTVPNAASTEVYRQLIRVDGVRVLAPTVGRLERYAQAYGLPISNAAATAYGDIVAELLTPTEVLTC